MDPNTFDRLFTIVFISFPILSFLTTWVMSKVSKTTKEMLLSFIIVTFPFWFSGSLALVIIRMPLIINGTIDPVTDSFALLAAYALVTSYFILASWPALIAYMTLCILRELIGAHDGSRTFMSLLSVLKKRRLTTSLFLVACIFISCTGNIWLLFSLQGILPGQYILFFLLFIVLIGICLMIDLNKEGKLYLPNTNHKLLMDANSIAQNISLASGIPTPSVCALAYSTPTAFTLKKDNKTAMIYITSGLLNLADYRELEAVIAHEMVSVHTNRIIDYAGITMLLSILRSSAYISFFLLLLLGNPYVLLGWCVIVLVYASGLRDTTIPKSENMQVFRTLLTLLNPPYLFVNLLSYIIFYALSTDEDFYSDIEAVRYTRYPKALYSILSKIEEYHGFTDILPENYYYLYFTAEQININDIPMPQPLIPDRKALLEQIDDTLRSFSVRPTLSKLSCPLCDVPMEEITAKGFYSNAILINRCPECGSVWFDQWELWYIADFASILCEPKIAKVSLDSLPQKFSCPRCGIEMARIADPSIPLLVYIWRCPSCNGNWLEHESIHHYEAYKKQVCSQLQANTENL